MGNHPGFPSPALPSSPLPRHSGHLSLPLYSHGVILSRHDEEPAGRGEAGEEGDQHSALAGQAGISRQQLINSPCPVCGDLSDSGERSNKPPDIPPLLQEIMNVEHLWFSRPDKSRPAPPYPPVQRSPP